MEAAGLPFELFGRLADQRSVIVTAHVDDTPITSEKFQLGNGKRRREIAELWSQDARLVRGVEFDANDVLHELDRLEQEALAALRQQESEASCAGDVLESASYVDNAVFVELAWNRDKGKPDFLVFFRDDQNTERADHYDSPLGTITPPVMGAGIATPGGSVEGAVLLPTVADFNYPDDAFQRGQVRAFINRYVELSADALEIAAVYVFVTWTYRSFDEIAYLAFRTADAGRGKSRALETVGSICYLPLFAGGGSSSAATLRMLDQFKGTLVADEFDQTHNTELGSELNKILCQGFQKNRPLIKCEGDTNRPRAFSCYGPKLFSLRGVFGDDAAETRAISIRMEQRTRRDIPITLPRQRFDAEALTIRNRLLAWRFKSSGMVRVRPELASPELEDRSNQIGLALMTLAPDDETYRRIVEALKGQQVSVAEGRADTMAGEVFDAITAIAKMDDDVHPGDVAKEINRRWAERDGVELRDLKKPATGQKVAWILRTVLELPRVGKSAKGAQYRVDSSRMEQLAKRFGASLTNVTNVTSSLEAGSSHENSHFQASNGVSDVHDDGDVRQERSGVSDDERGDDDREVFVV